MTLQVDRMSWPLDSLGEMDVSRIGGSLAGIQ